MRTNRSIRVPKVRVISQTGEQVGIISTQEAMQMAQDQNLDLVEISPQARPPVCKIMNYGKFRYDQAKKEKESKKAQHQVKIKEIKLRPNIDTHDLETKLRRAYEFLEKGCKVKFTCMFRGRELAYLDKGYTLFQKVREFLEDVATLESEPKRMGRFMHAVFAPGAKKK